MTKDSKLARARAIIEAHNASAAQKIDVAEFEKSLSALGATTEEGLAFATYEDLVKCGLPTILARQVASVFRETDTTEPGKDHISGKKADRMNYDELFAHYKPEEDDAVSRKLKSLAGNKRTVVFLDPVAHTIDIPASVKLLTELRRGLPELSVWAFDTTPRPIYKIGEVPNNEVDENPIYHGRPLRTGGVCDQLARSWEGVPLALRQLVYLGIKRGIIKINGIDDAHGVLDRCLQGGAEISLRSRYPAISIAFDERSKENQLPRLKVKLSRTTTGGTGVGDPFYREA
jgi:hypothetical protein